MNWALCWFDLRGGVYMATESSILSKSSTIKALYSIPHSTLLLLSKHRLFPNPKAPRWLYFLQLWNHMVNHRANWSLSRWSYRIVLPPVCSPPCYGFCYCNIGGLNMALNFYGIGHTTFNSRHPERRWWTLGSSHRHLGLV